MSESDGLLRLTEFLKQTKRQAEAAIDLLNEKLAEANEENKMLMQVVAKLEAERDHFKTHAEQLKSENSTKWRLQERDDWKSLVDSVQKDRGRIQDHCHQLELELEEYKEENHMLMEQINEYQRIEAEKSVQPASPDGNALSTPERNSRHNGIRSFSNDDVTDEPTPFTSPVLDRLGNEISFPSSEPKAITRQLKLELKKANTQLENERRISEENQLLQQVEINRLKEELSLLKPLVPSRRNYNNSSHGNQGLDSSSHGGGGSMHEYSMVVHAPKPSPSWFSLDFWFNTGGNGMENTQGPILKV